MKTLYKMKWHRGVRGWYLSDEPELSICSGELHKLWEFPKQTPSIWFKFYKTDGEHRMKLTTKKRAHRMVTQFYFDEKCARPMFRAKDLIQRMLEAGYSFVELRY